MLKLSKLSAGLRFVWKYAVHFLSVWWVICSNILTFCRKESIYSCRFLGTTGGGRREVSIGNLGLWPNIISKGDSWVDWLARVVLYAYVTWPCGGSCILTKGSVLTHWRNNSLVNWRNFIEETWKESVKQLWKLLKDGTAGMLYRSCHSRMQHPFYTFQVITQLWKTGSKTGITPGYMGEGGSCFDQIWKPVTVLQQLFLRSMLSLHDVLKCD